MNELEIILRCIGVYELISLVFVFLHTVFGDGYYPLDRLREGVLASHIILLIGLCSIGWVFTLVWLINPLVP